MKDWSDGIDAGFILLILITVMLWVWLLSGCNHKKCEELCPSDTTLHSFPEAGHGPNPFK